MGNFKSFIELAKSRKTTYEFSGRKLSESAVLKILEAARWAPSCSNNQPWHFILVRDKETITELIKTCGYGGFHTDPSLIIAVVLSKECLKRCACIYLQNPKLFLYDAYLCTAMPALNMTLEAQDLGIDSCLLTPNQPVVTRLLRIKKCDIVTIMVGFGYEKSGVFQKKRVRRELKELVFYEHYGNRHK